MIENELPELEKRVQGLFQSTLDRREPVLTRLPGILGLTNDQGSAEVSGKPGWVYVRIGNDETVGTAFNNRTSKRNGLPVIVGYDPAQPTLFQVLSTREVYQDAMAASGSLPAHHQQHEFGNTEGGEDLVYLRMRQMVDLMVYPTDPESLSVNVADGHYLIGATVYHYAGGTLDLTSYVPAASKKWVLVACDEDGPYVVDGTQGYYTYADIPDANDPTHYKLAGVLLKGGDTAITDWPNEARFVDLRLVGARSSASGGYVDWENVEVVAKSGGNYSVIQTAINAVSSGDAIYVLPGTWAENLSVSTSGLIVTGMMPQNQDSQVGVLVSGADNTGPVVEIDSSISCTWGQMQIIRVVSSGSGTFIGVDASAATRLHLMDTRVVMYGGSGTLAMIACKIGATGSYGSTLERCYIASDDIAASSGAALELVGVGTSKVRNCTIENTGDNTALRITGAGEFWLEECTIDGDVIISAAATVYFRNCLITGDFTISGSGASVYTRNVYIGGNISVGASDILYPTMTEQAASKTVSNSGTIIPVWFFANESTYTNHFWGSIGDDQATYSHVFPVGSVSGIHRASQGVFFTDFLDDQTNYEQVQLVAFDDGADIAGVLRTLAGGTGTLRDLWLGVGATKSNYIQINSSGDMVVPGDLTLRNNGLHLLDSNESHDLIVSPGSDLTADRTLTLTTGDADRTLTLSGNPTLSDWFDQDVKTSASPAFAGVTLDNTGLHVLDTNASHDLIIAPGSDLTADRTLTLTTGDASRTLTLSGNPTLDDWFDQSVKTAASPTFAGVTLNNTGLHLLDTGGDHDLIIAPGSDVSADRTLTLTTGDSDRTITLSGNPTLDDWFDQAVKAASSPTFAGVTLNNTGLHLLDTGGDHDLIIAPGSDVTADRTLTITTGDSDRTLTLSGNLTVESASLVNQDLTTDANVDFAQVTLPNTGKLILAGTGDDAEFYMDGSDDLYIDQTDQDSDIYIRVNDGGVTKTVIFIQGSTGYTGFGGETSPDSLLHLTDAGASAAFVLESSGGAVNNPWQFGNNQTTGRFTIKDTVSGNVPFKMDPGVADNAIRAGVAGANIVDFGGEVEIDVSNGQIDASGHYEVDSVQVVTNRQTGWAAPTGTADRTTFATSTVTLEELAERVHALIDDLTTHGLIGA